MSNIEKHRAFLESIDGEKGLPGSYHGVSLSMPIAEFERVNMVHPLNRVERYLLKRIEYLESRQIPDLKEKVKELVRDAMDAEKAWHEEIKDYTIPTSSATAYRAFRALCAPDKGGEVKP